LTDNSLTFWEAMLVKFLIWIQLIFLNKYFLVGMLDVQAAGQREPLVWGDAAGTLQGGRFMHLTALF
jgi:hypothetical protein